METPVTGYLERTTIRRVAEVLSSGGIAVLPTDTVYGFHCIASYADSIAAILERKGRSVGSGLIVLASSMFMVEAMVRAWPGESRRLLERVWPAALTAVLPASPSLPTELRPKDAVAIRIPALDGLRAVVRAVDGPIVSTSVNITGESPMTRIGLIQKAFPRLDAYISRRGRPHALPSTIVDFTGAQPLIRRRGRYRWPESRGGGTGS
jgi:tRNA threonylcarbamoyl adenosine modification protein (Sua5/YciO/YrdC/YwlC family)